ncbi:MAG: FKBP-type peptidyl-prolyl cis-trans isomerase [Bacteroidetes bacterium]|nr:FKBP-type peptidyl-prolyl cis-trans isomerase [Bacteroidota bacterium]
MAGSSFPGISGACKLLFIAVSSMSFVCMFTSCEPETRRARATDHIRMMDDKLLNYNQQLVRSENDEIEEYISRHQWKMLKTTTGLRYMIYEKGKGKKIKMGGEVRLKYSLTLLNGNAIYNSDSLGIKIIYPGTTEGETGLQEALLFMLLGDHAKLIVPSHLAYGLLGDLKKIPAGATLVYDIQILDPVQRGR